jgi:glycyl-tRNA synthetase beta chain
MRWGSSSETFIRPVRWVNVLMNDTLVDVTLFNVASKATTMVHRMSEFDAISVSGAKEYFETLKSGGVTLFQDERRKNILTQFDALEKIKSISIEIDTELLDEVVAITEHPTALIGTFDEAFLRLPDEVIITSMKEHQRYFPVFKEGKLTNQFCVVSNAYTENFSKIIEGNETVLRPRLADALFFYDNDLKRGLKTDGLEKVVFMKGLGSVEDKISREMHIATILHAMYHDKDKMGSSTDLTQAVSLAKADLMSEMVYEFTELQGLMGYYYATELGENEHVALAIKEQYLPDGEDSLLPSTPLSAIVAMSIKIDTLLALFSINQIPTGSRDPFALRRAVLGIMRIVKDNNFYFDIKETLGALSAQYSDIDMEKLENFIIERINQFYSNSKNINPSVIKSVLNTGERELIQLDAKINAVAALVESDSFATLSSTFKRVANISKDAEVIAIDEALFSEVAESKLFKAYDEVSKRSYENYEFELDALFSLKPQLDNFFDNVMVNAEDEAVKNNRKSLVATIYNAISKIADIKEITL